MLNILRKEMRLSASVLSYLFILLNDIVFSALLPIAKRDIVKGKYLFVCLIESCSFLLMALAVCLRMTVLSQSAIYRSNALMNANLFALGQIVIPKGARDLFELTGGQRLIVLSDEHGIALIPDEAFMANMKRAMEYMDREIDET